jgi:CRISPR-associated protein Csb2
MIALGIRYLTKYAVATNPARQGPEWPPHSGRVVMAMAAAHFETGSDPSERAALEWLEAAGSPSMRASDADERTTVRAYVPVNDAHGGIFGRQRQERAFQRARPHDDCVYLIWDADPTAETRSALDKLCNKVTRVGHSSSAVQMWVLPAGQEPAPNWLPEDAHPDTQMRVATAGTLRSLETAFNAQAIQEHDTLVETVATAKGREKTRVKNELQEKFPNGRPDWRRPQLVHWQGYGRPAQRGARQTVLEGPFDENFVVLTKGEGSALGLESTLQLTGALRNAAMKASGKEPPEWLSGHDTSRAPSLFPHVAFFPLPYVGFEHSDGHVLGLGMAIPRDLRHSSGSTREEELRQFLGPLFFDTETGQERAIAIWRTGVWQWTLERENRERPPMTLQRSSWTRPSRMWASVMPVVLHHYPKKREGDIERIVKESFVSALFPEPLEISISGFSAIQGAGNAMSVPPFTEGGTNLCRYQTHVVVRFAQRVRGPMVVGRGRFRGYGLFRPMPDGGVQ